MGIKCFLITSTQTVRIKLRRFVYTENGKCSSPQGYHCAMSEEIGRIAITERPRHSPDPSEFSDDQRWPTHCACGYQFQEHDEWQCFTEEVFTHDGKEYFLREPVPGMMYDADWLHDVPTYCGPDGRSLHVVCPDGHTWCIDSRASNCTLPQDNDHKCWVRHGEAPDLTVDKNGRTCAAGAGSIQTPKWHGFLRGGQLVE